MAEQPRHNVDRRPPEATVGLRKVEFAAALGGCVFVLAALAIIWIGRLGLTVDIYVSGLGAAGMPTAKWFEVALLLIVVGASAIAWAGRAVRSSVPIVGAWTASVSLWIGCGFFLFASQVTCTFGCPLPYGPSFTWQDFAHTLAAVLAFAAACWAMIQTAFSEDHRVLVVLSRISAVLVAVIASTGGIFSLLRFQAVLGSRLEFVATTLAIGWLVIFGGVLAARSAQALARHESLALHKSQQAVG